MPFIPLSDTLSSSSGSDDNQDEAKKIVEISEAIFVEEFGEEESKSVRPLYLKNRTLTITCTSSDIAQEIRSNQASIVEKINEKLGSKEVDRIRYLA